MADIFLSYANRDVNRIKRLVDIFEQQGWSVWWDLKIEIGKSFDQVIEEEITKAKCVVVLWSSQSTKSDWVKSEADEGKRRHILVPVLLDNVVIPMGFRYVESAKLYDWNGDSEHPELKLLLQAIADIIGEESKQTNLEEQEPKQPTVPQEAEQIARSNSFGFDFAKNRIRLAVISVILLAALVGTGLLVRYSIHSNNPPTPASGGEESHPTTGQAVGIDVNSHTKVDWTKVNKNFVSFTMIKATQGTSLKDQAFDNNWKGAKDAGIIRGAYHYFIEHEDAAAQANFFLSRVKLEAGDLPPVLDIEETPFGGHEDNVTFRNRVRTWLSLVQRVTGRRPIIYTYAGFWDPRMTDEFGDYPLWVASYGGPAPRNIPKGWKTWNFWQYSDRATLEGIEGPINTTIFNGSYQDLQTFIKTK